MDTEQQIRLNFLEEAEEYLDRMESNLLGLTDTQIDAQKVDIVLRAAHSIKGGAAMMGFDILSTVAHRLEDFLKILRVRYAASQIDTEVETLLLQSVDCLRDISDRNRQGKKAIKSDVSDRTKPIFEKLHGYLGELEIADENALLAQDEDVDPALMIFEEGVDGVLDRFESKLQSLGINELAAEISSTAQELMGFGYMAGLDSFIELCESIQQHSTVLAESDITPLSDRALKAWRRSHALVMRGSIEKLPSALEGYASVTDDSQPDTSIELENREFLSANVDSEFDPLALDATELSGLQSAFAADESEEFDPLALDATELSGLQSAFAADESEEFDPLALDATELSGLQSAFAADESEEFDPLALDATELSGLQSAFAADESEEFDPLALDTTELSRLQSAFELESFEDGATIIQQEAIEVTSPLAKKAPVVEKVEKMVRVPTSQLKQFNTLFEQLVLNRNSINLRLQQLQNVVALMTQRMTQMERSNIQLKQWYDRASVEGLLNNNEQSGLNSVNLLRRKEDNFDSLEMDRYSDIHLICQEQIETIVQLQEVATDIELGVQEVHQSVRELHYTTKSMQGNVTRTQMLPFTDAVKRLPRVIRDLNLQFNKKVNLRVIGETTLLDRSVIEALGDPLMHLLRNSFDHGIEDTQTRIDAGKSESGMITIQASNQGTYSVITLSDDGAGINLDKIRDRVCQMGISPSEVVQIPEVELLDFIFEPGFSTAKQVTELSGRGVGMDIVKTSLEEIRGDIKVSTYPGKGTTFTLRIPFTLSILRVAIVEQSGIIFAIPANNIKELISFESEQITTIADTEHIPWSNTEIPLIKVDNILVYRRSHKALNLTGEATINQTMTLVVGDKQSFAALKIDRFWDEQESTIRSIESPVSLPPGVISSVVFGDGKVIPLIDPMVLVGEELDETHSELSELAQGEASNISTIKTVLVVDDSINVRRYLSLTLEKAGYRVEQARDGQEAVDKLLGGLSVQAVICDLEMPRLDGYGVLEEIKERPEFSYLPIAMLTSRSNEKHRKLAMNLGASAYFAKPYNEKELLNKLGELANL